MAAFPDKTSSSLTEEIGRGIMRVRRLVLVDATRRLEERGQAILPWQVLNFLSREGASQQGDISRGTGQHPTGLSRLLRELEEGGCVRRIRSTKDKRRNRVEITRKGKARLEAGRPAVHAAYEQVLAPLRGSEREALRELLAKILLAANPPRIVAASFQDRGAR
jgi:DNA-binding MarR family transcriptional regulator